MVTCRHSTERKTLPCKKFKLHQCGGKNGSTDVNLLVCRKMTKIQQQTITYRCNNNLVYWGFLMDTVQNTDKTNVSSTTVDATADQTQSCPSAPPVTTYDSPSWLIDKHVNAQSVCLPFTSQERSIVVNTNDKHFTRYNSVATNLKARQGL